MNKEEITEIAQELTIKNVTDGKNKYFSWGFYKGCVVGLEYNNERIAELEEANKTLATMNNNMWVELEKKRAESQGITNKLHQLIKAKEIIKDYMIIVKGGNITACSVPEENRCINVLKLNEQAKQFLSEVEQC